jgi:thiol-disulfide isomerase/thioredoxin
MSFVPFRRNTVILGIVLLILAIFGWAGWANWEYRQQAAERLLATEAKGELVPDPSGGSLTYISPLRGKMAPAFSLEKLSGGRVSLANYRDKALLINFWATWCAPCKIETPWLVELRNKYAPQGFEILGIDAEGDDLQPGDRAGWAKDKAAVTQFVRQMKMPYPVLLDGDSISTAYGGVDELPTSLFVDRQGKVVASSLGLTSESEIEANIKKALAD